MESQSRTATLTRANMKPSIFIPILILFCLSIHFKTSLTDNDPLQDMCPTFTQAEKPIFINGFPCKNPTTIVASDFKTSKLNHAGNTNNLLHSSVTYVTAAHFPGLNTLGLSIARTDFDFKGVVLPHSHPRASEMFYVSQGVVVAGFIDTAKTVFAKILHEGDVFVFPQGLLHFSWNAGFELATVFSVMNSQNPGEVGIADAWFLSDTETNQMLLQRIRNATISSVPRTVLIDNQHFINH